MSICRAKKTNISGRAQDAVYGCDPDTIVDGPAAAELHAVNGLVETVPTTLPGLLAFLSCLAKLHKRDSDMFDDQHTDPLVQTLGKAAALIS